MGRDLISTVLKEGTIVYTRLCTSNIWHQNIICMTENKSVWISLLSGFLENIIMPDQQIIIKFTNEEMEYLFEGSIAKIQPEFPSLVKVNVVGVKKLKNARVFPRYDIYLAANIRDNNYKKEYFAIVHDISLVGMAFYSKDDFEICNDQLNITIYLPNKKVIEAKGIINRKITKDWYIDYGMRYTNMQEENNNSLSSFFSQLEEEKSSLRENFINSIKKHLS